MKKMKIKYFICLILFISILGLSCKKGNWYDVKSNKQLSVPTTLKDMQALMDDGRTLNTNMPYLKEVASDGHYLDQILANSLIGGDRNAYTWTHEQRNENIVDWVVGNNGSYRRVYYANLVLEGLEKIKPQNTDQVEWANVKGQALFHRALAFYELSQTFAEPYEVATAESKLGIPLRLESDVNIPSKRSNLKQTYDQIIEDLTVAKDILPITPMYKTRPSKTAVLGLLARIFLSMGDYVKAEIYAGLCLNIHSTLMDYKSLNATSTTNPIMIYNPEMIFYSSMTSGSSNSFTNNRIDPLWYNLYSDNDLRKKIFFNRNANTGLITSKGTYCGIGFNLHFTGLATDEIYLIRSECYARSGKIAEALADLNTLLKTRWQPKLTPTDIEKPYADVTATDKEDALRKVLEERKKELIMRGLRWSDLRRLNRDPRFAVTLTRTIGGKTYTLEPNSYKYTFPIPDDIIEKTGMEQNEGW